MCLLDLFDNLPHLRLSQRHMEMMLWMLEQVGARDMPSFYALQLTQQKLCSDGPGILTKHFESSLGNVMHCNDIPALITHGYANPQVSALLRFYPEDSMTPLTEFWEAKCLKELPPDLLTLMYWKGLKYYYVNEICQLDSGELVIPSMWII
ncbi:hypothetical protein K439DRAFT_1329136 [Ramaria rubella]|nr:hypothetical protein K439DRAFT_1329136 [Ramaria rubella]